MSIGRRCALGCRTWPDSDQYSVCPRCESPTRRIRGLKPVENAESERKHAEFERFYERDWTPDVEDESPVDALLAGVL